MLMNTCFGQTHTLYYLVQSLSMCVFVVGLILMAYVIFNGMYYDSLNSEDSENYDTTKTNISELENNSSQELILSKLFNKNK